MVGPGGSVAALLLALGPGMAQGDAPQTAGLIGYGPVRMLASQG